MHPPATVAHRINRLENDKIIEGYITEYSNKILGKIRYKARISTEKFSEKVQKKIYEYCKEHPDIVYFARTIGKWNIEIEADVSCVEEYEKLILGIKSNFADNIGRSESMTVFREYKWTYWPGGPESHDGIW